MLLLQLPPLVMVEVVVLLLPLPTLLLLLLLLLLRGSSNVPCQACCFCAAGITSPFCPHGAAKKQT
jgi:hypothetical protein